MNKYIGKVKIDPNKNHISADILCRMYFPLDYKQAVIYMHNNLEIEKIESKEIERVSYGPKSDESIPFIQEGRKVFLDIDESKRTSEMVSISMKYSGEITKIGQSGINRIEKHWVELGIYAPWFPLEENFPEANFEIDVEFTEDNYVLIGSPNIKKNGKNYKIEIKKSFSDCSFVASDKFVDQKIEIINGDNKVLIYYIDEKNEKSARKLGKQVKVIIDYYTECFGEIENSDYTIAIVPRGNGEDGGGYNRPGFVVLPDIDDIGSSSHVKYGNDEYYAFKYLAHELAHLWWHGADPKTWEDWLNESFAEYSSLMALEKLAGKNIFDKKIDEYEKISEKLNSIWGIERDDDDAFDLLYVKGPYLIHKLKMKIGKEGFLTLTRSMHSKNIVTTNDFLKEVKNIAGENIANDFEYNLKNINR
ncbi:MAG: M1 family aminopeptidase [Tissierellales bacterium]|nr:M1 family aminopeptidase [Tissierellales bacterium]